jgi:hypothetical protein
MLDIDYSGAADFWDLTNKRSLSIEEAVNEGYFATVEDAQCFLDEYNLYDGYFLDVDDYT